jgi:Protein of unknown function (DUF992)
MSDIVGSSHSLACVFTSAAGPQSRYAGVVHRVGVDVGFTQESAVGWAVFGPTHRPRESPGSLRGVTADAAVGVGCQCVGGRLEQFFRASTVGLRGPDRSQRRRRCCRARTAADRGDDARAGAAASSSPLTASTRLSFLILVLYRGPDADPEGRGRRAIGASAVRASRSSPVRTIGVSDQLSPTDRR